MPIFFCKSFKIFNLFLTSGLFGSILFNLLSSILALSKFVLNLFTADTVGLTLIKLIGFSPERH